MQPEHAIKQEARHWAIEILDDLEDVLESTPRHEGSPGLEDIQKTLLRLKADFPKDNARLSDVSDLLFGAEIIAYGDRTTSVFTRWSEEKNGSPSLVAMLAQAADRLALTDDERMLRAAFVAAVLAECPNTLLYHGNEHYRKVVFHTIRMLVTHMQMNFDIYPALDKTGMLKMIISAIVHDLCHEGGDNLRDGIYTPGFMEQRSFDIVRPYFESLGLDRDDWGDIETIVFCTDITFFAGDNSPCSRMKKIYGHFFGGGLPEGEDIGMMTVGKLRLFDENPKLALMAMMMHEADIATSAGLSYEQSIIETIHFMEERDLKTAGPAVLLRFLTEQMDGRMMTPAAQALFGSQMAVIMQQAEDDLRRGCNTFYKD